jgi:hypothetical protein
MIAHKLIENARAAGCSIEIEGGDLVVEADCDPPADLIASLRRHKAELIAFLLPSPSTPAPSVEPDELSLLRDGRRLHRFRAADILASPSPIVAVLMEDARSRGAVLVADGVMLIVVEPRRVLPPDLIAKLHSNAGSIIGVLRGEHRHRTSAIAISSEPRDVTGKDRLS